MKTKESKHALWLYVESLYETFVNMNKPLSFPFGAGLCSTIKSKHFSSEEQEWLMKELVKDSVNLKHWYSPTNRKILPDTRLFYGLSRVYLWKRRRYKDRLKYIKHQIKKYESNNKILK